MFVFEQNSRRYARRLVKAAIVASLAFLAVAAFLLALANESFDAGLWACLAAAGTLCVGVTYWNVQHLLKQPEQSIFRVTLDHQTLRVHSPCESWGPSFEVDLSSIAELRVVSVLGDEPNRHEINTRDGRVHRLSPYAPLHPEKIFRELRRVEPRLTMREGHEKDFATAKA
jgi:hypothetical protein